ncbi:MAG: tyrosine-type recombinase/integrase [Thermosynechococcaceae cyanobacterium MS004]|nr:tyrosine-type recombinase/integrase [Thermosynechococcaceae cyanobacterium MS004]
MNDHKMKRTPRGGVTVQVLKERLRLVWSHGGKRYFLSLGLADTKLNRLAADIKARQIEADIVTANFDPTLNKYRGEGRRTTDMLVTQLFERFTDYKSKRVDLRTLQKYRALLGHLSDYFGQGAIAQVREREAEKFKDWMLSRMGPGTFRDYLSLVNACWLWGIRQGLIQVNPWADLKVRVNPKQRPKPFTREEIKKIVEGFRAHSRWNVYGDFVEFLFGTGCRTGEAVGLRWQHVSEDFQTVWIGESISRGRRKTTKTNRARYITLSPRLSKLLQSRKPLDADSDELVFCSPQGFAIDDHNFRNRAWTDVLTLAGVEYRKPYSTRSTLISHLLDMGRSPAEVAELVGDDVATIYKFYAGNVTSRPRLPNLLD